MFLWSGKIANVLNQVQRPEDTGNESVHYSLRCLCLKNSETESDKKKFLGIAQHLLKPKY
jgi:hypothetical protein